jgi:hypothetical protein
MRPVTMRAELPAAGEPRPVLEARFPSLRSWFAYRQSMRFLHPEHDEALELSLDDVFSSPDTSTAARGSTWTCDPSISRAARTRSCLRT